jgi:hypothetical protein
MHFKGWLKMALPMGASGFVLLCFVFCGVAMTSCVVIGPLDRSGQNCGEVSRTEFRPNW